jgi:hypothetical protein
MSKEKARRTTMTKLRFPTPDELYALERAARRARNEAMARLFRAGARALRAGIARVAAVLSARKVGHA